MGMVVGRGRASDGVGSGGGGGVEVMLLCPLVLPLYKMSIQYTFPSLAYDKLDIQAVSTFTLLGETW